MELRQIRYFLAAYDTGSVSAAAKACRIAQPSVSQAIANLEAELGAVLFERTHRGLTPTDSAHALESASRQLLADAAALKAKAGRPAAEGRPLSIHVHPTLAARRLVRVLGAVTGLPEVNVQLTDDAGSADIALAPRVGEEEGDVMWSEEYFLCLPRSHPLALKDRLYMSDLKGQRFIARCHCERPGMFPAEKIRPRIVAIAADEDRALALVAAGIGAAIIPGAPEQSPSVAVRRLEDFKLTRQIVLSCRPSVPDAVRQSLLAGAQA